MIKLQKANKNHISSIISLARITWQASYINMISQEQIDFMLNKLYDDRLIQQQMDMPTHHFTIAIEHENIVGYTHCIQEQTDYKLSKLYVLPSAHGKGLGRRLLQEVEDTAKALACKQVVLNVNRKNPAKDFYQSMGYTIVEALDIPFDKFWLNDYIMQKNVK